MTGEFIQKYCQFCDRCIYEDDTPLYCGEIDDEGCISDPIKHVQCCYYEHQPIPHIPKFKVGDVISYMHGDDLCTVMEVNDDTYVLQKHGTTGRFNEPYPIRYDNIEEIDEFYELYEDTKTDDVAEEYCDDELELILPPKKKTILIEDVIKWFEENLHMYNTSECNGDKEAFIEDFKKHFEYESNT